MTAVRPRVQNSPLAPRVKFLYDETCRKVRSMNFPLPEVFQLLMRPPGGGIPTFSAGKGHSLPLQAILYQMITPEMKGTLDEWTPPSIEKAWKKTLEDLKLAKVAMIGVPLDTGAGIRRGAAYGPTGVRKELYRIPEIQTLLKAKTLIDCGDILVNPHLLHDSMLNQEQITLCQNAMYPQAPQLLRSQLPVSALSQLKLVLQCLLSTYPQLKVQIIGGDHSVAWPVSEVFSSLYPGTLGIVQPDAHTDLLASRLGVKYCFGTWSYHANQLLGGNGKLVQLGIRHSGRDQAHWETSTGVKQYWAHEINSQPEAQMIQTIIEHLKSKGIKNIYFSNDIDGTDETEAAATGTPAPEGLTSHFIIKLIEALGKNFNLVASDIVEVAPDLAQNPKDSEITCQTAALYLKKSIQIQVHSPPHLPKA